MSRGSTLRLVRRGLLVGGGAASLYFLHRNDYDINSIGAMRLGRAGLVAGKIILDYKLHFVGADFRSEETRRLRSEVHQRSADKLLQLACDNGGVWIKVGQHLGALEYLLPSEYTRTLSKLHSDAPKSSFSDVCKVVKAEFGKEVSEIFSEFSESPIGAASLAQVHKAVLRSDGTTVAVKVQHPRVKPHSRVDCITMEVLVKVVARIFPEFKLLWLAEEMKKNLPVELNFELEGKAADRVRKTFAYLDFLKIPLVHWELTTDRVLTMEFVEGGKVNDLDFMREHKVDTNRVRFLWCTGS